MPSIRLVFSLHTSHMRFLIFKHMKTVGLLQAPSTCHSPIFPFPQGSTFLLSDSWRHPQAVPCVICHGSLFSFTFPSIANICQHAFLTRFFAAHSFASAPRAPSGLLLKLQYFRSHSALGRNLYPPHPGWLPISEPVFLICGTEAALPTLLGCLWRWNEIIHCKSISPPNKNFLSAHFPTLHPSKHTTFLKDANCIASLDEKFSVAPSCLQNKILCPQPAILVRSNLASWTLSHMSCVTLALPDLGTLALRVGVLYVPQGSEYGQHLAETLRLNTELWVALVSCGGSQSSAFCSFPPHGGENLWRGRMPLLCWLLQAVTLSSLF